MMLLPPANDKCPVCASDHTPDDPHNCRSMYYQYRFYGLRGRWPTWADAIAHCDASTRSAWKRALIAHNIWSEPADGEPIADPPAESLHQAISDPATRSFAPEEIS